MISLRRKLADEPTSAPTMLGEDATDDDAPKEISIFVIVGIVTGIGLLVYSLYKCCCSPQPNKRKIVQCLAQE